MSKKEYKFNPQTLTYEVISAPFKIRFYRILRKILIGFILASLFNFVFSYFFYTPKMYRINKRNDELVMKYDILVEKIAAANKKLEEIRHRDEMVYRSLFGVETAVVPIADMDLPEGRYKRFRDDTYTPLMTSAWEGIDALTLTLYRESVSLDELQLLSKDKEKMTTAIPAIWPIDKRLLRGSVGPFGGRNHPILHRFIQHTGIDLAGNVGDPIYATGDGVVMVDPDAGHGYGNQVLINHGFGYKTRYAHLNKILVVPGQVVQRGELIAELGNTGRSTGPHLHYEVIYMGTHVDPANYISRNMSEEEFNAMVREAAKTPMEEK